MWQLFPSACLHSQGNGQPLALTHIVQTRAGMPQIPRIRAWKLYRVLAAVFLLPALSIQTMYSFYFEANLKAHQYKIWWKHFHIKIA